MSRTCEWGLSTSNTDGFLLYYHYNPNRAAAPPLSKVVSTKTFWRIINEWEICFTTVTSIKTLLPLKISHIVIQHSHWNLRQIRSLFYTLICDIKHTSWIMYLFHQINAICYLGWEKIELLLSIWNWIWYQSVWESDKFNFHTKAYVLSRNNLSSKCKIVLISPIKPQKGFIADIQNVQTVHKKVTSISLKSFQIAIRGRWTSFVFMSQECVIQMSHDNATSWLKLRERIKIFRLYLKKRNYNLTWISCESENCNIHTKDHVLSWNNPSSKCKIVLDFTYWKGFILDSP